MGCETGDVSRDIVVVVVVGGWAIFQVPEGHLRKLGRLGRILNRAKT